jgi:hypothetical protein
VTRHAALDRALAAHPERFPRGRPTHDRPPKAVWINPPLPVPDAVPQVTPKITAQFGTPASGVQSQVTFPQLAVAPVR